MDMQKEAEKILKDVLTSTPGVTAPGVLFSLIKGRLVPRIEDGKVVTHVRDDNGSLVVISSYLADLKRDDEVRRSCFAEPSRRGPQEAVGQLHIADFQKYPRVGDLEKIANGELELVG
jgi:hypothetical protein